MEKLHITMIHDLVCSWCPIGYNNIKTAFNNLNIEVDFHFLPYELNPVMGEEGESIARYFSRQSNWNERQLFDYQTSLVNTAANAGVNIDFSKRKYYYNTHKGHLLMHWSERFNKQVMLNESLIKAYFEQGLDISNTNILLDVAAQVGLDRALASDALSSTLLEQELASKIERQKKLNLSSIPAFVLNEKTFISGSKSVEFFENTLTTFINEPLSAA